ncbi:MULTISPECIES: PAS domain-containing sensor histidine kinase [Salinivibrio]|uniref:histidine kinase n=1 Tax=Salinivibrio proteolyticus TaxID=334715 RepID=A0ABY7LFY7_9GAMM|nr:MULTISPECIES: ATP-binding protein [Salinivibrio]OOF23984.1 PAS domain-containing sensor histidine kinase [Salinivibrio sp. IB574]OOF28583.1 PAS domain-containing sensor histidine kinase [Salinivibrio sp. IB872]PCE69362.1 PAS domain-containing sensor histidine kinase [Salinivibrio sp. YCSC6]QCF37179.1 PAS domain-containing protein [Salinivibrio sp. YCSC6]WBA16142.1 ATP-binding protein [Salinivibrio proteolyticus]
MESQSSPLGSVDQQVTRYKQVLDVMPAGVILLDSNGRVAEANPEARRLLGEPLTQERWFDVIQRAFSPRDDDGHEVSLKDGRRVKLAISASDSGQLILITDMTETRLLQSRVSDLQRLSSLGKMVASLAHQVRTPLSSAMLYAANLGAPNLNEATRQRFQLKLLDRLHDLEKQVNDMLLFAKGGDNKVVDRFTVEQLFNEFEPMVDAVVQGKNVDFAINSDDESVTLLGNVNALASALSNLVVNAIQVAGKACQVVVDARTHESNLLLSVADNGPGIAPELQAKVLEPFFTTRQQGTGLGLAVVQMVCHAHKGTLTLQSEPGQGACFTLCLPLADTPAAKSSDSVGETQ